MRTKEPPPRQWIFASWDSLAPNDKIAWYITELRQRARGGSRGGGKQCKRIKETHTWRRRYNRLSISHNRNPIKRQSISNPIKTSNYLDPKSWRESPHLILAKSWTRQEKNEGIFCGRPLDHCTHWSRRDRRQKNKMSNKVTRNGISVNTEDITNITAMP